MKETLLTGKMCLVTGASGFIGYHVAKQLVDAGARIRVLVRPTSNTKFLDSLPVEKCVGDILDIPSIEKSLNGVEILFHVAGFVGFKESDGAMLRRVNVQGVKNVLGAAQQSKVKRVVLTSSIAAIGASPTGELRDETHVWNDAVLHTAYSRSKRDGEMEAMKFYREGLPLVVVNPAFVFGASDYGPSAAGIFLLKCLRGKIWASVPMGFNAVDVQDVARGHLLAAIKGRLGERYILANQNLTLIEFLRLLEKCGGAKAPRFHIPYPAVYGAACLFDAIGWLLRKDFILSRLHARRMKYDAWYSHKKASRELGWVPRPVEESFTETVRWFKEHHLSK
ncbi:MAG: SDR family oxidoreductase [Candidatus Omnitrophota bacterium]